MTRNKASSQPTSIVLSLPMNQPPLSTSQNMVSTQPTSIFLALYPELRVKIYKFIAPTYRSSKFEYQGLFLSCRQIKSELEHECILAFNKFIESIKEAWRPLPLQPLRISPYPITHLSQTTKLRIGVSGPALVFIYDVAKNNAIDSLYGNLAYSLVDVQRMMAFLRLLVRGLEAFEIYVDARDALGVPFQVVRRTFHRLQLNRTMLH